MYPSKVAFVLASLVLLGWLAACRSADNAITPAPIVASPFSHTPTPLVPTAGPPTATPTPVPPAATATPVIPPATPVPTVTSTPKPSPILSLPACLPSTKLPKNSTVWVLEALDQAEASGHLPKTGQQLGDVAMSYDNQELFMGWQNEDTTKDLLAYNLADQSVRLIAHLKDLDWAPSPASDCIIVWGTVADEKPQNYSSRLITDFVIIDHQGRQHQLAVRAEQLQPPNVGAKAWSPDGWWLAIATGGGGYPDHRVGLFLVKADGSEIKPLFMDLPFKEISIGWMAWSPTGKQIAVVGSHDSTQYSIGTPSVFLIDVDTGERRLVTDEDVGLWHPSWSSDGRYVYFHAPVSCYQLDVATGEISEAKEVFCDIYPKPDTRP